MTSTPNPIFKFGREHHTVKVENIAVSVSRSEIVDLFGNLIGDVKKCEEHMEGPRRRMYLTFHSQDAAKKALCMSGYNVAEVPLTVTAAAVPDFHRIPKQNRHQDARRNLYVLGLPFDLTKSEFMDIFSRYGIVSHAVILATVDNASRRRGFIVMNSHGEAKCAMDALSRTEIKGHIIDVSWAVVQRSQGFLDGGDRMTVLSSHSPSPSPSPFEVRAVHSAPASGPTSVATTPTPEQASLPIIAAEATKILVSNLPAVLFSSSADLHPLLCPYGDIKKLEIVDAPATDGQGDISVIIEYATAAQARDARDALYGQMYSTKPVNVEFLSVPAVVEPQVSAHAEEYGKRTLNPYAAPFAVSASGFPHDTVLVPVSSMFTEHNGQPHIAIPASLLSAGSYSFAPYAPSPALPSHLSVPVPTVRPNSAPSIWRDNTLSSRPSQSSWALPHVSQLSNLSTPSLRSQFAA